MAGSILPHIDSGVASAPCLPMAPNSWRARSSASRTIPVVSGSSPAIRDASSYASPTIWSCREYVTTTGPFNRPPNNPGRNSPSCTPSHCLANPNCENAPWISVADDTGNGSQFASAEAITRAPKLCPARCSRTSGRAARTAASTGTSPLPTAPDRAFIS